MQTIAAKLQTLNIQGDILTDRANRLIYATDASAYKELPVGIVKPKNDDDIEKIIAFANENKVAIIPRTAGTSLAGQVVGNGLIVDVSRYMTSIIEINREEHWVRVQPGVVLDELNKVLEPYGLFFGPETSTSNRCMIAGMVGNNSCGAHSLVYGSTRDHTLEIKAFLSDGSKVHFKPLTTDEFNEKLEGSTLENQLYRQIYASLADSETLNEIAAEFPDKRIHRRNTGYAIDLLADCQPFNPQGEPFNFCRLLAGSEGTLAISTEIKLNLVPLPPKVKCLVCVHCETLEEAFNGNLVALKHRPVAIELMDDVVLELTKDNIEQRKNRFFLKGDPKAILIVEFAFETLEEIEKTADAMELEMRSHHYGYHFPRVFGADIPKVWNLRKAGLGILSNFPGDAKPVPVIEDTAVLPEALPQYMADFQEMMARYNKSCVYYAHIATGELHLRPVLNLKDTRDIDLFYTIAFETAKLVKKYKGSLSGEHGDGRLRGEFIPMMIGARNYALLREIKKTWDPDNIFNPGKITATPSMKTHLRFTPGQETREVKTYFDFSGDHGFLRAVEKCNGSADCRKTSIIGGTMCPSYMASYEESQTTRARANILREMISSSNKENPFDHQEIYDVLDLCLSCKGCKAECPSNVDMARYKAEFLQHWYDTHGVPLRAKAIANIGKLNKLGMIAPGIANFVFKSKTLSGILKRNLGFAEKRSIPILYKMTLSRWASKNLRKINPLNPDARRIYFYTDEFTEYNDVEIGIKALKLLTRLGYYVEIADYIQSARTYISKGLINDAKKIADQNILIYKGRINDDSPLIGLEPSAILGFRDEFADLVSPELKDEAVKMAPHCLMIDEFIDSEITKGRITPDMFTSETRKVILHGHCHQKSLASTSGTKNMLSLPENYSVEELKTGCCGMAGSFGYEEEHFDLSMKVGELVLFPAVRKTDENTLIAAPGTSCRHQIKDGTGKTAYHPVEILYNALKIK